MKLGQAIRKINIFHPLCRGVFGAQHVFLHRAVFGIVIMVCGVLIAKTLGHHPEFVLSVVGDAIGYGLHGIGLIPFVEEILLVAETEL